MSVSRRNSKGAGTLLHEQHVCYSFHENYNKLETFTDKERKIQKREEKF
jgi:hypothetical protein